jgi:23S rRNA (guanosine2251-2'-O)-methyltransferase
VAPERTGTSITVHGRLPVLEALADPAVAVTQVLLARTLRGPAADEVLAAAAARGVTVRRLPPEKITRISGDGRHDQGVVADIAAPGIEPLADWLGRLGPGARASVLVLDGVTNPANVGMLIRSAAGAGLSGVVLPEAGSPDVGPLVVRASAGIALRAAVLRCPTAAAGVADLAAAGLTVHGLRAGDAEVLFTAELPERAAYVLGNETEGVSPAVAALVARWLAIPLAPDVESLNVASAGAVVAFEVARRRQPEGRRQGRTVGAT